MCLRMSMHCSLNTLFLHTFALTLVVSTTTIVEHFCRNFAVVMLINFTSNGRMQEENTCDTCTLTPIKHFFVGGHYPNKRFFMKILAT